MLNINNDLNFPLHHSRPRFKNNIEDVLIFMAFQTSQIAKMESGAYQNYLFNLIRRYPGNLIKADKTINNWRTEITAFFAFVQYEEGGNVAYPGKIAQKLARDQDLAEFFRYFLISFQYPGGFLKNHIVKRYLEQCIEFKPAKSILKLIKYAESTTGDRFGITKAETTHLLFNDLKVTRGEHDEIEVFPILINNRERNIHYVSSGDVTRTAGDILDYMVLANLLVKRPDNKYYINTINDIIIDYFIDDDVYFQGYNQLVGSTNLDSVDFNQLRCEWFDYVNNRVDSVDFSSIIDDSIINNWSNDIAFIEDFQSLIQHQELLNSHDIGVLGESLALSYEIYRLNQENRDDLTHLVQRIPNEYAMGFDIKSRNSDASDRNIEVKTTMSRNSINHFTLTRNEWNSANSNRGSYYIYRIFLSTNNQPQIYIIKDPINSYCGGHLTMELLNDGAIFRISDFNHAGSFAEL